VTTPVDATARTPAAALSGLVAVLTLLCLELMRSSGPLIDYAFAEAKMLGALGAGLVTYAAPGLLLLLLLVLVGRQPALALLVGTLVVGGLRLTVQALSAEPKFYLGLVTVAMTLAVLTTAVRVLAARPGGGNLAAYAVAVGVAGGVGLQLVLGTWDAYWRRSALGWTVSFVVVGSMVALAVLASRGPGILPTARPRRVWALGPLLALLLMMLAHPGFAASQAGVPLAVAGPLHALGLIAAAALAARDTRLPRPAPVLLLPASVALVLTLGDRFPGDGVVVLLALLVAQVTAVLALAAALAPAPAPAATTEPLPRNLAGTATLVGLGAILPPMLYQVDYEIPLGFPNELVLVAAGALLGLAALRRRVDTALAPRPLAQPPVVVASAAVLVGAAVAAGAALTNRADEAPTTGNRVVMSWNIHYAVNVSGALDPETVARTIERYDPDVVLLNEVSYGWILGGGMDLGTWLSQRLDRPLAFAPAADRQFGSAVLSRWPMDDVEVHELPQGEGSQRRSAVSAQVYVGGRRLEVVSVQLQNKAANAQTRVLQVETMLEALDGRSPLLVAGDLNANPGTDAIGALTGAGLVSAIDEFGDDTALTYPATSPEQRLDWVLGREVTFEEAEVLEAATAADHLPILVTVAPPGG
jgi:endonuclease/exonuclease/phosphatase family metal-dependent hydrolase